MWRIEGFLVAIILFLSFSFSALSAVPEYNLNKEKSTLKFYAINNNAPVEGEFKDFSADIKFDKDNLKESSIKVEVKTSSVFAEYEELVSNLVSSDWLSVKEFPEAVFVSKTISRMPDTENYYSDGELSLRGKTVPVTLNFQLKFIGSDKILATGQATLRRSDFGIGQGEWAKDDVLKDEVRVQFRVMAVRK
ncbi:MAG: YceI family protein [Rickettsiales bacterium]